MYTYSAKPSTIEEVQTTIEKWFGTRYKRNRRSLLSLSSLGSMCSFHTQLTTT
jgi:hypothetical protein